MAHSSVLSIFFPSCQIPLPPPSQSSAALSVHVALSTMEDNLHTKPRKELKQLCTQFNIRTAGVKHDELVRLLREKLYPPLPDSPRLRAQKSTIDESITAPKGISSQGRSVRTLTLENESSRGAGPASKRKVISPDSGLPRKPLLTKSNSTPVRRTDLLRKKVNSLLGIDKKAQENAYVSQPGSPRRLGLSNGSFLRNRKRSEAPESTPVEATQTARSGSGTSEAQVERLSADAKPDDIGSPRESEADDNGAAIEPSEQGSDYGSRSVSEVATDVGPYARSEYSDADEARSVSSEPISRSSPRGERIVTRTESNQPSLSSAKSGLSFVAAGSGDTGDAKRNDRLLKPQSGGVHKQGEEYVSNTQAGRGKALEDIFPEFIEGTEFLIGETDGLESSFLDVGAADPQEVGREEGQQDSLRQSNLLEAKDNDGAEREEPDEKAYSASNTIADALAGHADSSSVVDENVDDSNFATSTDTAKDAENKPGISAAEYTRFREFGTDGDDLPASGGWYQGRDSEEPSMTVSAPSFAASGDEGVDGSTPTTSLKMQNIDSTQVDVSAHESECITDEPDSLPLENGEVNEAGDASGRKLSDAGDVRIPDECNESAARLQDHAELQGLGGNGRNLEGCVTEATMSEGSEEQLVASTSESEGTDVSERTSLEEKGIIAAQSSATAVIESESGKYGCGDDRGELDAIGDTVEEIGRGMAREADEIDDKEEASRGKAREESSGTAEEPESQNLQEQTSEVAASWRIGTFLTAGLKVVIVIGSLTFSLLKWRASFKSKLLADSAEA